jgi:hypothetical protein
MLMLGTAATAGAKELRFPAPSAADQRYAEKNIRDTFGLEFGQKQPEDETNLARMLIRSADEAPDDRAVDYRLLLDARDLAGEADDVGLGEEACQDLARRYQVSLSDLRVGMLKASADRLTDAGDHAAFMDEALRTIDDALLNDELDDADETIALATQAVHEAAKPELAKRLTCARNCSICSRPNTRR